MRHDPAVSPDLNERHLRRLRLVYGFALSFIALTILLSSLVMHYAMECSRGDSRVINLAGRQRMLSQRLTKCVLALAHTTDSGEQAARLGEITTSLATWRAAHLGLQHGDDTLGLPTRHNSAVITALFAEMEPFHAAMVLTLENMLTQINHGRFNPAMIDATAAEILGNEPHFLALMDRITFQYDQESKSRLDLLQYIEWAILAVGLLVLLLEFLLVFRPSLMEITTMAASLRRQYCRLEEVNTHLRKSQDEISRGNEQLRKANEEKDRYISIIAHDLRNPLAVFLGYTELLVKHLTTMSHADLKQITTQMHESAVGIDRLLTNLLEWSTMQLGHTAYDPQPGQLAGLVSQACDHCGVMADQKGVTLVRQVPEGIAVLVDWTMIISAVRNFVSNAIKFTPAGGTVTVSATRAGGTVTVSITDTGIGMSRTMVDELFRLDRRAKRKGTAGEPGTGLGLFICDGFIKRHGGNITVESAEGQGTTVRFTLPAAPPAA